MGPDRPLVMREYPWKTLLETTAGLAADFLEGLSTRPVRPEATATEMLERLKAPVPEAGEAATSLLPRLARQLDPGLMAMPGGRFFGWVIGGSLPGALAADWLTSVYDQNTGMAEPTPAAAMIEQVVLSWVRELLHLPAEGGGALVTGGQMANTVCLLTGRNAVLWDAG